jgi:cation diffusion facilitator family transporter
MASGESKTVIYAALAGNALIAVAKFVAAGMTGSSAMLSEGVHSVVDTGNQGLLLLGMHRAAKPADDEHPFGHGAELYFWAFVVAILVFAVGAGVSLYEGVTKIADPEPITSPTINYIVLGIAFVAEGAAWTVAYRSFRRTNPNKGLIPAIRQSKDPSVFTVLFEDTAALLGLVAAFAGVTASAFLGLAWADGAASIVIAVILAVAALLLAIETKGLLIGEAAAPAIEQGIRELVAATPGVEAINELRTLHRGPEDVLLALSVDLNDAMTAAETEQTVSEIETAIRVRFPRIGRMFVEVQSEEGHRTSLAAQRERLSAE